MVATDSRGAVLRHARAADASALLAALSGLAIEFERAAILDVGYPRAET